MDDSIYDPNQSNMIIITDPTANDNDLPVTFGPVLFDVLQSIADQLGVQYLIGMLSPPSFGSSSSFFFRRPESYHAQFLKPASSSRDNGTEARLVS